MRAPRRLPRPTQPAVVASSVPASPSVLVSAFSSPSAPRPGSAGGVAAGGASGATQTLVARGDESGGGWALQLAPGGRLRFVAFGNSSTPTWTGTSITAQLPAGASLLPPANAPPVPAASSSAPAPAPEPLPAEVPFSVRVPAPASVGGFLQSAAGAVPPGAWVHVAAVVTSSNATVPLDALPAACRSHFQLVDVPAPKGAAGFAMPAAAAPAPPPAAAEDAPAPDADPAADPVPTRLQVGVTSSFSYSGTVVQLFVNGVLVAAGPLLPRYGTLVAPTPDMPLAPSDAPAPAPAVDPPAGGNSGGDDSQRSSFGAMIAQLRTRRGSSEGGKAPSTPAKGPAAAAPASAAPALGPSSPARLIASSTVATSGRLQPKAPSGKELFLCGRRVGFGTSPDAFAGRFACALIWECFLDRRAFTGTLPSLPLPNLQTRVCGLPRAPSRSCAGPWRAAQSCPPQQASRFRRACSS